MGPSFVWAGLYLVPALLWGILAERTWYFSRTRRPHSWLIRMLPVVTALTTLHLVLNAALWLLPAAWHVRRPSGVVALYVVNDLSVITSLALFRHLLCFVPWRGARPRRVWLASNYGPAAALAAMALFLPLLLPGATLDRQLYLYLIALQLWVVTNFVLIARQLLRMARGGIWGPGVAGAPS